MARFRLSRRARADVAGILAASEARWGTDARRRYEALLAAAMRQVAADPEGRLIRVHEALPGVPRSFHLRHVRPVAPGDRVRRPVHVPWFRPIQPGLIEIIAVLRDRMDPASHIGLESQG